MHKTLPSLQKDQIEHTLMGGVGIKMEEELYQQVTPQATRASGHHHLPEQDLNGETSEQKLVSLTQQGRLVRFQTFAGQIGAVSAVQIGHK